jgi:hypothetical protein
MHGDTPVISPPIKPMKMSPPGQTLSRPCIWVGCAASCESGRQGHHSGNGSQSAFGLASSCMTGIRPLTHRTCVQMLNSGLSIC